MLRVIPRDLFNDSNLLFNYGQLYIQLEHHQMEGHLQYHGDHGDQFAITQDENDGSTTVDNIELLDQYGNGVRLYRPLNSREKFSLWFYSDDEDYPVFTEAGVLSRELMAILNIKP